jgi:hypothetical protein
MDDNTKAPALSVRQLTEKDVPEVVSLQRRVYPDALRWTSEELLRHLSVFPAGQLVAVDETGRILGSASSLIIDSDDYAEPAKWSTITGHGTFDTHDALGKTLYGADMCVDPLARRQQSRVCESKELRRTEPDGPTLRREAWNQISGGYRHV